MTEKTDKKPDPNMDLWKFLGTTDKAHTKSFNRSGGFKGTAIKPMYAIKKMTERFGVCGTGWGYTQPEFSIIEAKDGVIMVFADVGLWYTVDGKRSDIVWGQGGDFIIGKNKNGLFFDDEARKKCATDALMSAMKHIGMSADVHMGQFDGSKYAKDESNPNDKIDKARYIYSELNKVKDKEIPFREIWFDNQDFINELAVSDNNDEKKAYNEMYKLLNAIEGKK